MENSEQNNQVISENFSPLPEEIESLLFKKVESKFTRLFKKVMPRYFSFDRVNKEFFYKKTKDDPKIIKVHSKHDIINYSPSVEKNQDLSKDFKFGFKLFTTTRTYVLYTNDKNDYDKWMRMFNFYFYGIDPVEEKEKLKSNIKKIQMKLYYPHHEFQFYKNISFTLEPRGTINFNDGLEELIFYDKRDHENNMGIKEKAILLDNYPLKENMDFNRKKLNLVKRYFKKERDGEKYRSNSMVIKNKNSNNSNLYVEGTIGFENVSNINPVNDLNFSNINNNPSNIFGNSIIDYAYSTIQKNVQSFDFLAKRELNNDTEILKEINKKYSEFLEWPVEEND
jgi:hypothetical protein